MRATTSTVAATATATEPARPARQAPTGVRVNHRQRRTAGRASSKSRLSTPRTDRATANAVQAPTGVRVNHLQRRTPGDRRPPAADPSHWGQCQSTLTFHRLTFHRLTFHRSTFHRSTFRRSISISISISADLSSATEVGWVGPRNRFLPVDDLPPHSPRVLVIISTGAQKGH